MQKKLIALAVAAISAAPAFAQSNVTVYGRVDYGFTSTSGSSGGINGLSRKGFDSGVQAGSRLGFKGMEDLGNGLKAIFEIESGINVDQDTAGAGTAAGGLFSANRHSYVGLTGNFGTVVGGRLDGVRYGIWNKYDPFAGGTMGNITQITAQVDRADNAVAYISPNFSGFTVTAAYSSHVGSDAGFTNGATNEAAGNVGDGKLYTIMANYNNGPIDITADFETVKETKDPAGNGKHRVSTIGGSYDFGMVKLSGLWDSHKANTVGGPATVDNVNYRAYMIGLSAPVMGKGLVKFAWGKVDDKLAANADTKKIGLGFDYALSKRTNIYTNYGKITNSNNATARISFAANAGGIPAAALPPVAGAGAGVKGFDLGIAHKF